MVAWLTTAALLLALLLPLLALGDPPSPAAVPTKAAPGEHDIALDLLSIARDDFQIPVTGLLHVGAHLGEEAELYEFMGVPKVLYVEAHPQLYQNLSVSISERFRTDKLKTLEVKLFNFAADAIEGEHSVTFHTASWSMCGSLLALNANADVTTSPSTSMSTSGSGSGSVVSTLAPGAEEVRVVPEGLHNIGVMDVPGRRCDEALTADDLADVNVLVIDVQGAEINAIKGSSGFLNQIEIIITEVHYGPTTQYDGAPTIEAISQFLSELGFKHVVNVRSQPSWGDALFVRRGIVDRRVALSHELGGLGTLETFVRVVAERGVPAWGYALDEFYEIQIAILERRLSESRALQTLLR